MTLHRVSGIEAVREIATGSCVILPLPGRMQIHVALYKHSNKSGKSYQSFADDLGRLYTHSYRPNYSHQTNVITLKSPYSSFNERLNRSCIPSEVNHWFYNYYFELQCFAGIWKGRESKQIIF